MADELHFGRAAKRLHMAQPPLSQQIRQLEAELGVELFERSTRRVALTEAGRLFYPEAARLLLEVSSVEQRVSEIKSGDSGRLRLGFVASAGYEVVPQLLRLHRERWPGICYQLTAMSSAEQHQALVARTIDLGLARAECQDREIAATPLVNEQLLLAVPADHCLADDGEIVLASLGGQRFIGLDRQACPLLHSRLLHGLAAAGVDYQPMIEGPEYSTVLGLVAAGHGVAVVPGTVGSLRRPGLRYLAISDATMTSSLFLLSRTDERSPIVERTIGFATEVIARITGR